MMTEHDIDRIRAAQAGTFRAQEAATRSLALWLRACGAPLWITDAFAAGADWLSGRAEAAEDDPNGEPRP